MASRQEDKEARRQERAAIEAGHAAAERNRVLIGLPDRLDKANRAVRELENLVENIKILYSQRVILKDEVVLDQIGELLGVKHESRKRS